MYCAEILGNINDPSFEILLRRKLGGMFVTDEAVVDAAQRQSGAVRVVSESGVEVDIDLDAVATPDGSSRRGRLLDGDVLATFPADGARPARAVVVRLRRAQALRISARARDVSALARACWEGGNMHAPLFESPEGSGAADASTGEVVLLTPANEVLERMLRSIPGIGVESVTAELDSCRRYASSAADAVVGLATDFTIVRRKKKGQ